MEANKCHSCQEEMSSGEDKAHAAVTTVAVDALQCDPEPRGGKGSLSIVSRGHPAPPKMGEFLHLASAKTCPMQ